MTTGMIDEKVDEQTTLGMLDTHITKRQEAARLHDVVSLRYRELIVNDADAQKATQQVDQLETRLKAFHKQVLLGGAKAGELPALKEQLAEARERQTKLLHALDEQRELFCLAQETLTQFRDELQEQERQLRDTLTRLFNQRFAEDDADFLGRRGQVSWMVNPDPTSHEQYAKQWRGRVFNYLLFKGFMSDLVDNCLLSALSTFFRNESFQVRVISGFIPVSSRNKAPLEVGALVSVPGSLSEAEAFEEITRRRVQFVTEA